MNILTDFYIFETIPKEERQDGHKAASLQAGWWSNLSSSVQRAKQIPYAFTRRIRVTSDVAMVTLAIVIASVTHAPALTIIGMEILFLVISTLQFVSRIFKQFLPVVGVYLAIIIFGIILNLFFPGGWGSVGLYMLCVIMLYRFPLSWSLSLAGVCLLALIATDGALRLLPFQHPGNIGTLLFTLALSAGLCWFGWTQRAQYLLVVRLHETQEQLREQMARTEALAAEQERTRIARDIHDVLSHSLAVLSIQVQAARRLVKDPERLTAKLDDMATLIRESIAESRHVVGLLREQPSSTSGHDDLSTSLHSIATTFNERTGISCRFEERGIPHKVGPQQKETLQLALREMLTNAHRHGGAQTAWISLRWQEVGVALEVHDDGIGSNATLADTSTETNNGAGGHHGLQGMCERAAALNGEVEAGPAETGGFTVSIRLPYEKSTEKSAQKVRLS